MSKDFLWCEKYRPSKVSECVLPDGLKSTFNTLVSTGELPNMLFTGTAGVGKTTVAKALCKELDLDYIVVNGSEEGNIDTLRNKIKHFASTVSLQGGYKVVSSTKQTTLIRNLRNPLSVGSSKSFLIIVVSF